MLPLGPEARSAVEWSWKNVLPWMLERGKGFWGRFLRKKLLQLRKAEFQKMVAAFPAQGALDVQLICRPQTEHGLYVKDGKARVSFCLRVLVVAPFGVQPSSLTGVLAALCGGARVTVDDKKLTQGMLGPGESCEVEVEREVTFHDGVKPPTVGMAVPLYFGGSVTALGPWPGEYDKHEFAEQTFMNVREG